MSIAPSVSVIVPFFADFPYLEQSLGALLAAGDAVGEIIVVNDRPDRRNQESLGSLAQVPKLRIVHNEENLNAAASRNRGLHLARHDYVMFHDADDIMAPRGLAEAVRHAADVRADMLHLPTWMYRPSEGLYFPHGRDEALFGRKVLSTNVRQSPELRYAVANWSFLYRRDFMLENEIAMDPGHRKTGDHLLIIKALRAAERVACSDRWIHFWRDRPASLSRKSRGSADHRLQLAQFAKSMEIIAGDLPSDGPDFQRDLLFCFMRILQDSDYLPVQLEARHKSAEAAGLLEDLACALDPYELKQDAVQDAIYRLMYPDELWKDQPRAFTGDRVNIIYDAIRARDWDTVAGHFDSPRMVKNRREAPPLVPGWITRKDDSLVIGDVFEHLLQRYLRRTGARRSKEHRSFSQFFVDTLDSEITTGAEALNASNGAQTATRIRITPLKSGPATTVEGEQLLAPTKGSARARFVKMSHSDAPEGWLALDSALDTMLREANGNEPILPRLRAQCQARAADRIGSATGLPVAEGCAPGNTPDLVDLGLLAQGLERTIGGPVRDRIWAGQLVVHDRVAQGNCNVYGERTLKSRLRAASRRLRRRSA